MSLIFAFAFVLHLACGTPVVAATNTVLTINVEAINGTTTFKTIISYVVIILSPAPTIADVSLTRAVPKGNCREQHNR